MSVLGSTKNFFVIFLPKPINFLKKSTIFVQNFDIMEKPSNHIIIVLVENNLRGE